MNIEFGNSSLHLVKIKSETKSSSKSLHTFVKNYNCRVVYQKLLNLRDI